MSRFAQQLRHAAFSEIVAVGGGIVVVWIEAIRFVANVTALTSLLYTMYVVGVFDLGKAIFKARTSMVFVCDYAAVRFVFFELTLDAFSSVTRITVA